ADIRDESDRDGMRVVIELKREVQPHSILAALYKMTPLQSNFGVIMLALVDGQPVQLPLKRVLEEFLQFREDTLRRSYRYELDKTQTRSHILEGLLVALDNLDLLIDILRNSADGGSAKVTLQNDLDLSDRQADAILAMPMRRLTGLEQQNLLAEFETLQSEIQRLEALIGDRQTFLKQLKKDLRALKKKYGDGRRTSIQAQEKVQVLEPVANDESVLLEITQKKYVRALTSNHRSRRKQNPEHSKHLTPNKRDLAVYTQQVEPGDRLVVFTDAGKAFSLNVSEIPLRSGRERGTPLITLLPSSAKNDEIAACFLWSAVQEDSEYIFLTANGKSKALPASEFEDITNRGLICMKLQSGDRLQSVVQVNEVKDLLVATSNARVLRFLSDEVPVMGRSAQGTKAIKLLKQEKIVGFAALDPDQCALLVSKKGYVKRFPIEMLRQGLPGDLGTQLIQRQKSDEIIYAGPIGDGQTLTVCSEDNSMAVLDPNSVASTPKTAPTAPYFKVSADNRLIQAF
ncbi:MAG: DNA gyrase subunit A, partial [Cyanobacteria bacterium P01_F01_bin.42]